MYRFISKGDYVEALPEELKQYPIPDRLMQLLWQRGFRTKEELDHYLWPKREDLHDPMRMQDMEKAVHVIRTALAAGEHITIFGDYDVDGVTATAILTMYLRSLGCSVDYYIPSRHGEGYGLNMEAVETIAKKSKLLITVDCGITCIDEVARARELGMKVIVTDHHQIGDRIPDCEAVLNPLLGDYPFRRLCGAGVAFKLVQALGGMEAIRPYWDLAALATIADIVPLIEENRVIVSFGLKDFTVNKRPGLYALMASAGMEGSAAPNASDIAFRLAPRINAGGRLALASRSVELLMTQNQEVADEIASELDADNMKRRELELQIFNQADRRIASEVDFLTEKAIVISGEGWNTGVVGLAAARLVEKYRWPTILLSETDGVCTGSARSIPGVDIYRALASCGDIFERFGGHAQAAGMTIRAEMLPVLKSRLKAAIEAQENADAYIPAEEYDLEVQLSELSETFVDAFSMMQPTGFGNPQPVFCLNGVHTSDVRRIGKDGSHLMVKLSKDGSVSQAIGFRMGGLAEQLPDAIDAIVGLSINEWQGKRSVRCELRRVKPTSPWQTLLRECSARTDEIDIAWASQLRKSAKETERLSCEQRRWTAMLMELRKTLPGTIQGVLLAVHTPEAAEKLIGLLTAERIAERLDYRIGTPEDVRLFNTLVVAPDWSAIAPEYHIIVADGFASEAEKQQVIRRFGEERVMEVTGFGDEGNAAAAARLWLPRQEMASIYRMLKEQEGAPCTLASLSATARMDRGKVYCALSAFHELGLISWREDPFAYKMLASGKVSLDDSPLRKKLKERMEA